MPFGSEIPLFPGAPQASYQQNPVWAELGSLQRKRSYMGDVANARRSVEEAFHANRHAKAYDAKMTELQGKLNELLAKREELVTSLNNLYPDKAEELRTVEQPVPQAEEGVPINVPVPSKGTMAINTPHFEPNMAQESLMGGLSENREVHETPEHAPIFPDMSTGEQVDRLASVYSELPEFSGADEAINAPIDLPLFPGPQKQYPAKAAVKAPQPPTPARYTMPVQQPIFPQRVR